MYRQFKYAWRNAMCYNHHLLNGTLVEHQSFTNQGWPQLPDDTRELFIYGGVWFLKSNR